MVYYIRFLKPPYWNEEKKSSSYIVLQSLITITTDLGDAFYPGNVHIYVVLMSKTAPRAWKEFDWKAGMRCLEIDLALCPKSYGKLPARLVVTTNEEGPVPDRLQLDNLPDIVSAWTADLGELDIKELSKSFTVRRFRLPQGRVLEILEENGESIALHIWDAAIAMVAWLSMFIYEKIVPEHGRDKVKLLELGSGCGIAGIGFTAIYPNSHVLLTDLDDALSILRRNIHNATTSLRPLKVAEECFLDSQVLDWTKSFKLTDSNSLDYILVSDCTYNCDSSPALVNTLSALVRGLENCTPEIIVSMKIRHPSEAVFFDLMQDAGFVEKEHVSIHMDDRYRQTIGQELETVDIYIFIMPTARSPTTSASSTASS